MSVLQVSARKSSAGNIESTLRQGDQAREVLVDHSRKCAGTIEVSAIAGIETGQMSPSAVEVSKNEPRVDADKEKKRKKNRGYKRSILVLSILALLALGVLISGEVSLVTAVLVYLAGVLIVAAIGVLLLLWLVSVLAG